MVERPSADITAPCPHASICGGCDFQDVSYTRQVNYKEAILREQFSPLLQSEAFLPFLATTDPAPFCYRNKIRYGFVQTETGISPSRHAKGQEEAEMPMSTCLLQSFLSVKLAQLTAEFALEAGWKVFNTQQVQGQLKHLLVREGKYTGEIMVSLVTTEEDLPGLDTWISWIHRTVPEVKSIYRTVTWGRNNEHSRDDHVWGAPTITEKVGKYLFTISPHAFFQTNSTMIETLYTAVKDQAKPQPQDCVWDLYAGSATIGIFLSEFCKNVLSLENNAQNIADARTNLEQNQITNVQILDQNLDEQLTSQFINAHTPDVIIVDPPRAGLSPRIRTILPHLPHKRLIYVSCNPATLLRDCKEFIASGWKITAFQGIDMFPHTLHCEAVVTLEK